MEQNEYGLFNGRFGLVRLFLTIFMAWAPGAATHVRGEPQLSSAPKRVIILYAYGNGLRP